MVLAFRLAFAFAFRFGVGFAAAVCCVKAASEYMSPRDAPLVSPPSVLFVCESRGSSSVS